MIRVRVGIIHHVGVYFVDVDARVAVSNQLSSMRKGCVMCVLCWCVVLYWRGSVDLLVVGLPEKHPVEETQYVFEISLENTFSELR